MVGIIEPIVVVGAGHAGFQLASSLRQSGYDGPVALINNEPFLPYQRPPLSKAYLQGAGEPDTVLFRPDCFYAEQRIDLVSDQVASIDRTARKAIFASGNSLGYRHLVFATGARNRKLQLPNADNDDVLYLRSLADGETIRRRLDAARRVVVIGAGFIGLEFAATAADKGIEVDVVELAQRIMARVVSPLISAHFLARHEIAGCRIHCGRSVECIEAVDGRLQGVVLDDGRRLAADLVVVGIGVVPNVELALDAGLPSRQGIVVDEYLATADPHISAIGDCALFSSPRYEAPVRLESVANATDQAKCLAARLTGNPAPFDAVPWFWSDQGKDKLQIAGLNTGYDRVVVRVTEGARSHWYFAGATFLAVDAIDDPRAYMLGKRLLEAGRSPDPAALADPATDLKTLLR